MNNNNNQNFPQGNSFDYIKEMVSVFKKLPGIGERSARRLVFHILSQNESYAYNLANVIKDGKKNIILCKHCFNLSTDGVCPICKSHSRNQKQLCVVENPEIIYVFEKSGTFNGYYHVLHGLINPLEGITPSDIRLKELFDRIENGGFEELILALNPNSNGEATSIYIKKILSVNSSIHVTALARGIPIGSDLEYVDKDTLSEAINSRKNFETIKI